MPFFPSKEKLLLVIKLGLKKVFAKTNRKGKAILKVFMLKFLFNKIIFLVETQQLFFDVNLVSHSIGFW